MDGVFQVGSAEPQQPGPGPAWARAAAARDAAGADGLAHREPVRDDFKLLYAGTADKVMMVELEADQVGVVAAVDGSGAAVGLDSWAPGSKVHSQQSDAAAACQIDGSHLHLSAVGMVRVLICCTCNITPDLPLCLCPVPGLTHDRLPHPPPCMVPGD